MRWLLHWILSALALLLVSHFVPGFVVTSFLVAMLAAVVIGIVNATLGTLVRFFTFPITLLTLGLFLIVINAVMLKVATILVPGFKIFGFLPALEGAVILAILHMVIHWLTESDKQRER